MSELSAPRTAPQASRTIDWLLVLSLAVLPLLQSLFSITGWAKSLGRPQTPLMLALVITVIWVAVVGLSRAARPVATIVWASAIAAVVSAGLSLLVPAVTNGDAGNLLDGFGVLATLIATLAIYLIWGMAAGVGAAGVQHLRRRHADQA